MARDFTFRNFLQEVGMRLGAAVVVVSVFLGVGYFNRTDFLGLSSFLGTQAIVAFASLHSHDRTTACNRMSNKLQTLL